MKKYDKINIMKGGFIMKGFLKFITILATAVTAVIGALAAVDFYLNRNRVKGDYLECEIPSVDEE